MPSPCPFSFVVFYLCPLFAAVSSSLSHLCLSVFYLSMVPDDVTFGDVVKQKYHAEGRDAVNNRSAKVLLLFMNIA